MISATVLRRYLMLRQPKRFGHHPVYQTPAYVALVHAKEPPRDVLCGCGWGRLGALYNELLALEQCGCPCCGRAFSIEEGWMAHWHPYRGEVEQC